MNCRQCGKPLIRYTTDICLECSKGNLKQTLDSDPALKKAYKEALDETFSDENIKKMTASTVKFIEAIQALQKK